MNLISQAYAGVVTWAEAEARIIAHGAAVAAKGFVVAGLSTIKQAASDAIGQADSALAANYAKVAKAAETALEAELAVLTRGVSTPLNPLISKGIDDLAEVAVKAAHAWALAAKAELAASEGDKQPGTFVPVDNAPGAAGQSTMMQDSRD